MGLLTNIKSSISTVTSSLFAGSEPKRIGIYGPPNAGKTTLANRIARDWTGDAIGPESHVPHETRRARRKEDVEIKRDGRTVSIDIVDTPGVTTKIDYEEFLEHDIEKEDAVRRSREATEGVAEAMHWLREDVDGVIYVLDATTDPFTQVNTISDDGVQIDMISAERMDGLRTMEKIRLILDSVHEGNIVILEKGLDPDEESKLIEVTMSEISPDGFTGIEIETIPTGEETGLFGKLMGKSSKGKLTVIGPANRIETLHKDENLISTLIHDQ